MNLIPKIALLLLSIFALCSCFNPNKLQHVSSKLVEIRPVSLKSVTVVIDQKVRNDARKIEILDSAIDVNLNEKLIGKVFLEERFVIEKGETVSQLVLKITLHTSIFNYQSIIREFEAKGAKVFIDGYVKVKYGMIRKKVKIKKMIIDPSLILGELKRDFYVNR